MFNIHGTFIINEKGEKTAVIINIKEYVKIMELVKKMEEFDCIDINYNIAKGLKDIEEGRVHEIDSLLKGLDYEA